MGSGCGDPIAEASSFVRQTTPHYGGTSRGKPYSVHAYHTGLSGKCKEFVYKKRVWRAFLEKRGGILG